MQRGAGDAGCAGRGTVALVAPGSRVSSTEQRLAQPQENSLAHWIAVTVS